jgi:hypothetical protein
VEQQLESAPIPNVALLNAPCICEPCIGAYRPRRCRRVFARIPSDLRSRPRYRHGCRCALGVLVVRRGALTLRLPDYAVTAPGLLIDDPRSRRAMVLRFWWRRWNSAAGQRMGSCDMPHFRGCVRISGPKRWCGNRRHRRSAACSGDLGPGTVIRAPFDRPGQYAVRFDEGEGVVEQNVIGGRHRQVQRKGQPLGECPLVAPNGQSGRAD